MAISCALIGTIAGRQAVPIATYIDTFDTDPTAYIHNTGYSTYPWNSAGQYLTYTNTHSSSIEPAVYYKFNGGVWSSWTTFFQGATAIEMDVSLVSGSVFGFYLFTGTSGVQGYSVVINGSSCTLNFSVDYTKYPIGSFQTSGVAITTGTTYTLRIQRDINNVFAFYINGVKLANTLTDTLNLPQYNRTGLCPGFQCVNSGMNVYEIRIYRGQNNMLP